MSRTSLCRLRGMGRMARPGRSCLQQGSGEVGQGVTSSGSHCSPQEAGGRWQQKQSWLVTGHARGCVEGRANRCGTTFRDEEQVQGVVADSVRNGGERRGISRPRLRAKVPLVVEVRALPALHTDCILTPGTSKFMPQCSHPLSRALTPGQPLQLLPVWDQAVGLGC